jgi:hypothetical protein
MNSIEVIILNDCLIIIKLIAMKGNKSKNLSRKELQTNNSYFGRYAQKAKINHADIPKLSNT